MLPRLFTHSHTYTHMCTLLHPHKCTLHPLQVARITSAEKQANSAKLLKLQADLGEGDQRQIMAGGLGTRHKSECCQMFVCGRSGGQGGRCRNLGHRKQFSSYCQQPDKGLCVLNFKIKFLQVQELDFEVERMQGFVLSWQ